MEESDHWDLGGIWGVQNHCYDVNDDLAWYDDDHNEIAKIIKQHKQLPTGEPAKAAPPIPVPTNYELLTRDSKIKEMANKHEVIRDALRELEVLIKLHENIDTE
jgi:hypothetical protein